MLSVVCYAKLFRRISVRQIHPGAGDSLARLTVKKHGPFEPSLPKRSTLCGFGSRLVGILLMPIGDFHVCGIHSQSLEMIEPAEPADRAQFGPAHVVGFGGSRWKRRQVLRCHGSEEGSELLIYLFGKPRASRAISTAIESPAGPSPQCSKSSM